MYVTSDSEEEFANCSDFIEAAALSHFESGEIKEQSNYRKNEIACA